MSLQHVDVAVVVPVRITARPSKSHGWHPGRLPLPEHHHGIHDAEEISIEWDTADRRLMHWLEPSDSRRWYRRPGSFEDDFNIDQTLRDRLTGEFGANFSEYRGEELEIDGVYLALDGVDLVRIHEGTESFNAIATIRFLFLLPPSVSEASSSTAQQAILAELLTRMTGRTSERLLDFYQTALGEQVDLGEHPEERIRLMVNIVLDTYGEDAADVDAQLLDWSGLADLSSSRHSSSAPSRLVPTAVPVGILRLWGTETNLSVGSSGVVVAHSGDGDFNLVRDAFILAIMQDTLLTAVSNAIYDASTQPGADIGAVRKLLSGDPAIRAHAEMHWARHISHDASIQQFYELVRDRLRLEARLEESTREINEAHESVARDAELKTNERLNLVAVLSLTVPVGLAIAQFQKPWPVESLIPAGIFAAAAATAILYKTLNRRIH